MIRLNRAFAVVLRQLYLMRGSPSRILPLFIWVAIDIVLWGFISRYLSSVTSSPVAFLPVLLGAVLFWDFFSRVMQGVTMAFFEDVWARNFLNMFATPLQLSEYLGGLVASSILTSLVGLLVMLALATGFFGLPFLTLGLYIIPFLLVLFLFGVALGIIGSAMVLRLGPAAEWLVWPIPGLLSPFAGVFYPVSTLPEWMRAISYLLPPTYVFEQLRSLLAGQTLSPVPLLIAATLALAWILAASVMFVRIYRYAVRTGLIARYSAETVS